MTQLKVDTITDTAGTAAPDLEDGLTVNGAALSTVNTAEYYSSNTEPSSSKNGAIWWDTANDKVMIYVNDEWKEVELGASAGGSSIAWGGDRHMTMGGYISAAINNIQYWNADSTTTTDFGDLTVARWGPCAASNATRCVCIGGYSNNVIDYVTASTTGNATDFGDTLINNYYAQASSDGTYAVFAGGATTNDADYITIATTGNASNFGTTSSQLVGGYGSGGDGSYGIFALISTSTNGLLYFTIGTSGSTSVFGNLNVAQSYPTLCHDATYTVISRGTGNDISYVTTATTGNATDFGDLTETLSHAGGSSDGTYGFFTGNASNSTTMNRITIATPGNASDVGDLSTGMGYHAQTSGSSS